jgi:5-methylcytosine-specific restriction endonuclease McrA
MAEPSSQAKGLSTNVTVTRSIVTAGLPYTSYLQELRFDFWYSCAYCSIAEIEATGIGFQIDHYKPQSTNDPDVHEYGNLMLSCQPCNVAKDDIWLTAEEQAAGLRFVRPDKDDLTLHYKLIGAALVPLTSEGEFTYRVLRLDRPELQALRRLRKQLKSSDEAIIAGLQQLTKISIDAIPVQLRKRFETLRKQLCSSAEMALNRDDVGELVRGHNKSPLQQARSDEQAVILQQKKARREYLRSIGAIAVK